MEITESYNDSAILWLRDLHFEYTFLSGMMQQCEFLSYE